MVRPEHRNAEIFGANVRRRREELGLNQRDFSQRLGIAQATPSIVETGAVKEPFTKRSPNTSIWPLLRTPTRHPLFHNPILSVS
jgi:transcriptional regulator with XRE-family HTH domain